MLIAEGLYSLSCPRCPVRGWIVVSELHHFFDSCVFLVVNGDRILKREFLVIDKVDVGVHDYRAAVHRITVALSRLRHYY